ncbi:hypothetical protein FRC04_002478 [Tulasnella sp. 424]|nr:hypothetical protein FRC04_002478 [Tulasnella sp. 424]KAG8967583.1 hypothetical protein FRC05_002016 [Tulasnella sp. 425]
MTAASFATADLQDVVDKLTTEEAISLISGFGFWGTAAVPRLGVPSIKVSDGPNGVRGGFVFNSTPANCIPCATALAATWDTELVREIASNLLAPEVKQRASSVLLAPTCNIQRSFESFAEDPHLSGHMAAAYINGLQSGGVGACIKHFVANDQEDERMGGDSIMSDRALREIYLYPFMLAEKLAKPMCYMTSYNKLNGTYCSENTYLLQSILRGEWKSEAMVMSDWFGVYGLAPSINAGVDLEMPGVNKWREDEKVQRCIKAKKITVRTVKERAASVLNLVKDLSKTNAEVIDGNGKEHYEKKDADCALMRRVAAESIVLLKNTANILPIKPADSGINKVAIIGPNAKATAASGGGSAAMRNAYFVSPFDGIVAALPKGVEVKYHEGCAGYNMQPRLDSQLTTETGEPGLTCFIYSHDEQDRIINTPVRSVGVTETNLFLVDRAFAEGVSTRYTAKFKGKLIPREKDERFRFGLTVNGRAKLYVDGKLVIDNWTRQKRGHTFFGAGTPEKHGETDLKAGVAHEIEIEYRNIRGPADGDEAEALARIPPGLRLGGAEVLPEQSVDEAAAIAKDADLAIVVVGLNGDWETEGNDRPHLELPGRTNELVAKVAAVSPKTVVVNQSGSAVAMPWIDQVSGLVHAWYLGNETGNAIADVLFGNVNPSGKMSMTFPKRLEDIPSYGFGAQNGKVRYGEDLYVGYKGYQLRNIAPLFPFGYGLSYTTFKYGEAKVSASSSGDFSATVTVSVTNTGSVAGSEAVQVYVSLPRGQLSHPQQQLKAFKKVKDLAPGKTEEVQFTLDKYAVSYWDDIIHRWRADKGTYTVRVGRSAVELESEATFEVEKAFEWNGL